MIEQALLAFSAARSKVDSIDPDEEIDYVVDTNTISLLLKKIRNAQTGLHGARHIITAMRYSPWRNTMLLHLGKWDKELDNVWQDVIDHLDGGREKS